MKRLAMVSCFVTGALTASLPAEAWARIKLITLPVRERVEVQLDNPNATLVEEERIVPLVKGVNQVDFSWAKHPDRFPDDCVPRRGTAGRRGGGR
jgi:hypothetical protein